ncbi:MAG TPA: glycosyltransferase family 2 protein [Planctomycetota bacterium]|nr:glycosyltransferase family 2 protein [Planctomycetota bacterium]
MTLQGHPTTQLTTFQETVRPEREFAGVAIGVVIPAYGVEHQIERVIAGIPDYVRAIVVVEDASRDGTRARLRALRDPRLVVIEHAENRGVGAAMVTGLERCLQERLDIVIKMDGDDQMDPAYIPELVRPLIAGTADMTKGNRYADLVALRAMPFFRIIGNAGLTFLVKAASGQWSLFDPANGYFAIRTDVLRHMDIQKLPERYFFESGLLIKLGILRAVVLDVAIPARYADEKSSLSITRTLVGFPPRLLWGLMRRLFWRYLVYDFTALSLYLLLGVPALIGGVAYGVTLWVMNHRLNEFAQPGQVMMAVMPIILGAQLVLQAIALDIANTPRTPISHPLKRPGH